DVWVFVRSLAPFPERPVKHFWWRVVSTKFGRRDLAVTRQRKVGKIPKCVNAFRSSPDFTRRIVRQVELGNRAATANVLDEQNAISREPGKRIHRSFSALRPIDCIATVSGHRKQIAAVKSFVAHQTFDERD